MKNNSQQTNKPSSFPPQHQDRQPGIEVNMNPRPISLKPDYIPSGKLGQKVALISGGDSGIGRAVSLLFAQEGADIGIIYLNEHDDANMTKNDIEKSRSSLSSHCR